MDVLTPVFPRVRTYTTPLLPFQYSIVILYPSPPLFFIAFLWKKKMPLLVAIVAHCVDKPYLMLYATYGLLERKHSGLNGMSYVYTHL